MGIVLDLRYMDVLVENMDFISLVMNEVKVQEYSNVSDDDVNLFKPVMFELFGNVQEMVVMTERFRYMYAFNLDRLSKFAFPESLRSLTIKGKWLKEAPTDSFGEKGWNVECNG